MVRRKGSAAEDRMMTIIRRDRPALARCWLGLALLLALAEAPGLEVGEVRWGFDGKVVPEHVNPLSLVVSNPSAVPFEGVLVLEQGHTIHEGAPWVEACYLAPGTSRRVQFHPWVGGGGDAFELSWKPGGGSVEVDAPEQGAPATVLLVDDGDLAAGGALKRFPDQLFPPTVAACDGLGCVVLDHAPRWQPAQRQALRDWLWRGGTLVLLPGGDGRQPRLGAGLELLDQPGRRLVAGAGQVLRLDLTRAELSAESLAAAGYAAPTLHTDEDHHGQALASSLFQMLNDLVKPRHAWALIFLVLTVYLLVISLGAWLAARLGADYRLVNLGVVAVIIGCSVLLWMVGRRGSGERAVLTTLAYAQALGGGDFAATQWSSCFVTSSGDYAITHPGEHNLFSVPGDRDRAEATVAADQGTLLATIPLFSSRSFVHCGRIRIPGADPAIVSLSAAAPAPDLVIELPAGGLRAERVLGARAVYRERVYKLERDGRRLSHNAAVGAIELADFSVGLAKSHQEFYPGFAEDDGDAGLRLARLDAYFEQLIAYGLGGRGAARQWTDQRRDPDQVALFMLVDQPPAFQVPGGITNQGRVVLRFDLPIPRSAP
jgi:hypothetical protein